MTPPLTGLACVAVATVTAITSTALLVASGGTNGFENLLIVALLTLMTTFATAFSLTRGTNLAILISAL